MAVKTYMPCICRIYGLGGVSFGGMVMDDLSSHEQNVYITAGNWPASIRPYRKGRRVYNIM